MPKWIYKVACSFIPDKQKRHNLMDKYRGVRDLGKNNQYDKSIISKNNIRLEKRLNTPFIGPPCRSLFY
ncbi:MAG: hypothetical protein LBL61_00845 [Elusimicrobiota bacterium]|jgi:hypothetical protein|nr:hypothetical protein [Elusimicrobiota bacterium]